MALPDIVWRGVIVENAGVKAEESAVGSWELYQRSSRDGLEVSILATSACLLIVMRVEY